MKTCVFIFSFMFSILISFPALATLTTTCKGVDVDARHFNYCVRKNTESKAIIYFFHGILGSSSSYKKVTNELDSIWQKKGIPLPNVVAISFGASWVMTEARGGAGLYKYFSQTAQPYLEKEFLFDNRFKRMVIGMSMGGFNAVQAFGKNPGMFERAAFICPALHIISPFSTDDEVNAFIKRTGATRYLVNLAQDIGRKEYADLNDWNQEGPFAVASRINAVNIPIYISIGDQDQFGFQEGAHAFSELMKTRSPLVEFYLIKGSGHCAWAGKELAAYLEPSLIP